MSIFILSKSIYIIVGSLVGAHFSGMNIRGEICFSFGGVCAHIRGHVVTSSFSHHRDVVVVAILIKAKLGF